MSTCSHSDADACDICRPDSPVSLPIDGKLRELRELEDRLKRASPEAQRQIAVGNVSWLISELRNALASRPSVPPPSSSPATTNSASPSSSISTSPLSSSESPTDFASFSSETLVDALLNVASVTVDANVAALLTASANRLSALYFGESPPSEQGSDATPLAWLECEHCHAIWSTGGEKRMGEMCICGSGPLRLRTAMMTSTHGNDAPIYVTEFASEIPTPREFPTNHLGNAGENPSPSSSLTPVAPIIAELEADALRVIVDFCSEKHVGFGGWSDDHAIALDCVRTILNRTSQPLATASLPNSSEQLAHLSPPTP